MVWIIGAVTAVILFLAVMFVVTGIAVSAAGNCQTD